MKRMLGIEDYLNDMRLHKPRLKMTESRVTESVVMVIGHMVTVCRPRYRSSWGLASGSLG